MSSSENKSENALSCRRFQARAFACIEFDLRSELFASGSLPLPSTALRDLILHSYLHWVHPLVPLLEFPYLLQRLLQDDDRNFPHIFLYQAILYAGSSFLDPLQLQEAGLPSRQYIGRVLRGRARLLYTAKTERNPIIEAQGLVLLSIRENLSEAALSESRLWVHQALSAAVQAALLPAKDDNTLQEKDHLFTILSSLHDRLFWSLYTADLAISLALDTPFQIPQLPPRDSQFISAAFAGIEISPAAALAAEPHTNLHVSCELPSPGPCNQLAQIMTQRSKLIRLVYYLLAPTNPKRNPNITLDSVTRHALSYGPKPPILLLQISQLDPQHLDLAETHLKAWLDDLPSSARYEPISLLTLPKEDAGPRQLSTGFVLAVHRAALHILCLALMLALYEGKVRSTTVAAQSTCVLMEEHACPHRHRRRHIASELVQTWSTLAAAQAIPFLPSYCLFSLRLAREVFDKWSRSKKPEYAKWAVGSCDRFLAMGFE
ncbi:hypothetical protein BJX63DRAFT_439391 [Aspergillus granulosus]|uniref:Xylanolytic transcriptional activator regulatory domain-containing protein n=1 Tax=Aspergillus granulosus TaxID=176169 RepID=A0ABR4GZA2_9EURO